MRFRGMAEEGMCVPFMRSRAESLANVVMDVVPSAVIVVDSALAIQEVSPSAERLLGGSKPNLLGRSLADFAPAGTFGDPESALAGCHRHSPLMQMHWRVTVVWRYAFARSHTALTPFGKDANLSPSCAPTGPASIAPNTVIAIQPRPGSSLCGSVDVPSTSSSCILS
jgi:hypothetical protein